MIDDIWSETDLRVLGVVVGAGDAGISVGNVGCAAWPETRRKPQHMAMAGGRFLRRLERWRFAERFWPWSGAAARWRATPTGQRVYAERSAAAKAQPA